MAASTWAATAKSVCRLPPTATPAASATAFSWRLSNRAILPYHPRGHAALMAHHGGLQRVDQPPAQLFRELVQKLRVHQVALRAVGQHAAPSADAPHLVFHANRGGEAAEEESARLQNPPGAAQHGEKLVVSARKVEHRATQHHVRKRARKGHLFDGFHAEVAGWKQRCQGCRQAACVLHGPGIGVGAEDVVPLPEKVDQVAAGPAPRVQNPHPARDPAAQKLVEQVDVDLCKLLKQVSHALARPSQFEGLTGAKPFRISEGYPRVFTTEKGGGDLFWRDLGGLDPGR